MVRTKNKPKKSLEPVSSAHNILGDLIVHSAAVQYQIMVLNKCQTCEVEMNKIGAKKTGIRCKECKDEHCHKCAGLTVELCEMMLKMEKGLWTCKQCEKKTADMKVVIESMNSIKSELCTIRQGQTEQQAEREQVLEGLEVVKAVAKKLDRIEEVQEKHEQRLASHDGEIKQN